MYRIIIDVRPDELTDVIDLLLNRFGGPIEVDGTEPRTVWGDAAVAAPSPLPTDDPAYRAWRADHPSIAEQERVSEPDTPRWAVEEAAIVTTGETGIPTDEADSYHAYVDREKAKSGQYARMQRNNWPDALAYPCTTCKARVNQPCTRANGAVATKPHNGRLRHAGYLR